MQEKLLGDGSQLSVFLWKLFEYCFIWIFIHFSCMLLKTDPQLSNKYL